MVRLMITGGHFTPALAVIEEILNSPLKDIVETIFVGRKYALGADNSLSLEYQEISQKKIKFIDLSAGRLTRLFNPRTIINLLTIPYGFWQAEKIIKKEKPDLILSFGGYLALPIAIIGFYHKIPIYTHEQTMSPGLANRLIGYFAKKIFVSFEESNIYFNQKKVIISGNPLRKDVFKVIDKPFEIKKNKPVIYVTGGSLGSHSLNVHLKIILKDLLKSFIIIHQTGETAKYRDFDNLLNYRDSLPLALGKNYYPKKHFYNNEIGYVYSLADLVVGRAGANTLFELLALRKPAVLVPLPWAAGGEQKKQAEILAKQKIGRIFDQSQQSKHLYNLIDEVVNSLDWYRKNFKNCQKYYWENAAKIILKEILAENK